MILSLYFAPQLSIAKRRKKANNFCITNRPPACICVGSYCACVVTHACSLLTKMPVFCGKKKLATWGQRWQVGPKRRQTLPQPAIMISVYSCKNATQTRGKTLKIKNGREMSTQRIWQLNSLINQIQTPHPPP